MPVFEAILSGVVQGITEFLPVSSSGHLVLFRAFFGYTEPGVFFDVCLHAGTLVAVLIFFREYIAEIINQKRTAVLFCLAAATVPSVFAVLFFKSDIERVFSDPMVVSVFLIFTGSVLLGAQVHQSRRTGPIQKVNLRSSVIMGIAQAVALFPGVSRSGTTISTGLFSGLSDEEAFRFSFLMSVPAISGALLFKMFDLRSETFGSIDIFSYAAGTIAAFVVGFFSLFILWKVISLRKLYIFGVYCLLAGFFGVFCFSR